MRRLNFGAKGGLISDEPALPRDTITAAFQLGLSCGLGFSRVNDRDRDQFPLLAHHLAAEELAVGTPWQVLLEASAALLSEVVSSRLDLRSAQVNVTRFGDIENIHVDQDALVTALVFINPVWRPDWLGELLFYDSDRSEAIEVITPKPGRIV